MAAQPVFKKQLGFIAERNPMHDGRMEYRVPSCGVSFDSLDALRKWAVGFTLVRIRANRRNRLFG